jgi:hypothetical protein
MAAAFKDLWRSYCVRHDIGQDARDFALDLMDRASDVMKARAALTAREGREEARSLNAMELADKIAADIEALGDG